MNEKGDGLPPVRDVRMRGFTERATVEAALAWIDLQAKRLSDEPVPLAELSGRVLSEEVVAPRDVPEFDRAMMDGFAVHASDTLGASTYQPMRVSLVGSSFPGQPYLGELVRGSCVRIMTGAPLPRGADAVLPAEKCSAEADGIVIHDELSPGKHVGFRGEDLRCGNVVLAPGRRLRPQDLGLLASIGLQNVRVVRRPRVAIIVTGNELCDSGQARTEFQIFDANGPMLQALVERDGGVVSVRNIVSDDRETVRAAMQHEVDVVLVSGGSSVGQEDHAPSLLSELGELAVHGIAMRPSSPAGFGRIGNRIVFLLPGNPVSCLCAYDFFAGRAIRLMGGKPAEWPYLSIRRTLRRKLVSVPGRTDYARVRLVDDQVDPIAIGGASVLSSTTKADGFVVVPSDKEGYPAGAEVDVFLYATDGLRT